MAKHKKYSSHTDRNSRDDKPSGMAAGSTTTFVHHVESPSVNRTDAITQARSNGAFRAATTRKNSKNDYLSPVDSFMFPMDVKLIQNSALLGWRKRD